jgi:hypothetical protein
LAKAQSVACGFDFAEDNFDYARRAPEKASRATAPTSKSLALRRANVESWRLAQIQRSSPPKRRTSHDDDGTIQPRKRPAEVTPEQRRVQRRKQNPAGKGGAERVKQ